MKNPFVISYLFLLVLALAGCAMVNNPCSPVSDERFAAQLRVSGGQLIQNGDNVVISLPADSCFEPGTTNFTVTCPLLLEGVISSIKSSGNVPITITGYTDNIDSPQQSQRLSRAQAESMVAYLWAHGVRQNCLYAEGKGADCAIANNATIAGNTLNRRIEISWRRN